jgi:hypothetical protein
MTNWTGLDASVKERFERGSAIIYDDGAVLTGGKLLQNYIDRVVQFLTLREMGLLAVLDRRQGSGPAAYVNQRNSADGGDWVLDNGSITVPTVDGTFAQQEFKYKTLVTRGTVSRKMQAIGQSYIDILAMEMAGKAEDFAESLENGMIYGNFPVSAAEPMGLLTLLEAANSAGTPTPSATADGAHIINNCAGQTTVGNFDSVYPLSLSNLDGAIDAVKGSAMRSDLVIIGSFAAIRQVNAALQAGQQFVNETEIAAGFRVRTYDGIPLVVSSVLKDALLFDTGATGKSGHISALTGGTGTQLLIINRRHVFLSELTPMTVLPLATTTSSSEAFDMYWDGAPVLANTYGMSILSNIAADGQFV